MSTARGSRREGCGCARARRRRSVAIEGEVEDAMDGGEYPAYGAIELSSPLLFKMLAGGWQHLLVLIHWATFPYLHNNPHRSNS